MVSPRSSAPLIALVLLGCAAHPLGEDWARLDAAAREERALEVLSALFAGGVDGAGAPFEDRAEVRADRAGVSYVVDGQPARVRWSDVAAVEATPLTTLPSRPETLMVYLEGDGEGAREVVDLVRPPLAGLGLTRPYLQLRSRPAWSRGRFLKALSYLRQRAAAAEVAAVASQAPAAREASAGAEPEAPLPAEDSGEVAGPRGEADLDAIEAKLRRLREWRDAGLIDEAEYEAKRRELLEGL